MPYIKPGERERYRESLARVVSALLSVSEEDRDGHVNFVITTIIKRVYAPPKYARYNKAVGVLACVLLELYRHVIGPYEISKMTENGDVE